MKILRPLEFALKPPAHLRAVLLYGNNPSLQRFYLSCLKTATRSTRLAHLDSSKHLPAIAAPSLFSLQDDRQMVFLATAGERDLPAILSFLEKSSDSYVLIIASTLATKSKIVSHFLDHKSYVALPCYDLRAQDLKTYIQLSAQAKGITLTSEALLFLAETFIPFPELLHSELDKLALYQLSKATPLDLETVKAMTGLNSPLNLELLIQALLLGDRLLLLQSLSSFLIEEEFILIVRTLIRNFCQLFEILAHMRMGTPFSMAITRLSTPVFFQLKPIFAQAGECWSLEQCSQCLEQLLTLEKSYKNQELTWPMVQAKLLTIAHQIEKSGKAI